MFYTPTPHKLLVSRVFAFKYYKHKPCSNNKNCNYRDQARPTLTGGAKVYFRNRSEERVEHFGRMRIAPRDGNNRRTKT